MLFFVVVVVARTVCPNYAAGVGWWLLVQIAVRLLLVVVVVCVCVCACVRACVRACVCVCLSLSLSLGGGIYERGGELCFFTSL